METNYEQLKNRILNKVYRIYFWRKHALPVLVESSILAALTCGALCMVSVHNVISNAYASKTFFGFMNFVMTMFGKTEFPMKILSVAVGVVLVLFVRDSLSGLGIFTKKIRSSFS